MERFWDARAREDPHFFVDDRLAYGAPDLERFWSDGVETLDLILGLLGVEIAPGDAVVEVGCGVGRITRPLAERAAAVHAFDVSGEMLARAREGNRDLTNVTWVQGSGTDLRPLGDAAADVCFSHVVFQHLPDPQITLGYVREMGRVLRPRGWAAFQISTAPSIHRPARPARRIARRLAELLGNAPRGRGHPAWRGSAVDLAQLRDVASRAGMETARVHGAGGQFCLVLLRRRGA